MRLSFRPAAWLSAAGRTALVFAAGVVVGSAQTPPVELPQVTVEVARPPPVPPPEVAPPGLAPNSPPLEIMYPAAAYNNGISKGRATVGVMLDSNGEVQDVLLLAYTEAYFGAALLKKAPTLAYTPLRFKGEAVPARYQLGHNFWPDPEVPVVVNANDALGRLFSRFETGDDPLRYGPRREASLDRPLEFVHAAIPRLPAGYARKGDGQIEVRVSFYVDEAGRTRLPNVDATPSAVLVAPAIKALSTWRFKPASYKGKPTLVFAERTLTFGPAR